MLYAIVVSSGLTIVALQLHFNCISFETRLTDRFFFLADQGTLMNVFLLGPALYFCSCWKIFGDLSIPLVDALTFATLICAVDPVAVKFALSGPTRRSDLGPADR